MLCVGVVRGSFGGKERRRKKKAEKKRKKRERERKAQKKPIYLSVHYYSRGVEEVRVFYLDFS